MKSHKIMFSLVLLALLLTLPIAQVSAQKVEGPTLFQLGTTHEMEVLTSATLVWQEDQSETVTVNMTMVKFPTNESTIEIRLVQFFTVEDTANAVPESQAVNTTEISLSTDNSSFVIIQEVPPPGAADRFYLNITISASAVGGNASQAFRLYSYRFPASDTIIVERDNLVPVINLYGFPPGSFFAKWLPIYGSLMFIMLIPGMIYGVTLLQERRKSTQDEDDAPELEQEGEGTNE